MNSGKQRKESINKEFERKIIYGLTHEWSHAVRDLPYYCVKKMRIPIFGIRDLTNRLGYWSLERREICLSRSLIFDHPWDAICEVLRHEMAHQLTHEVFNIYQEPPHGPSFQKACKLLKADPNASGVNPTLHQRIYNLQNSGNKIIDRIKKLMALAESQNQHEAEAAMSKAQELITKYNIKHINETVEREFVSVFIGKPQLRHTRDEYRLSVLLQDYYFVYGIWIQSFVLGKKKMGRVLEISGTVHNIAIASYVYDFVKHFINSMWERYNKEKKLAHHRKTDFAVGIIDGFESKLKSSQLKIAISQERTLIKTNDPLLKDYIKDRYPRTRSFNRRVREDPGVRNDGHEVGKTLVISKGISEKKGNKKGLIGWRN